MAWYFIQKNLWIFFGCCKRTTKGCQNHPLQTSKKKWSHLHRNGSIGHGTWSGKMEKNLKTKTTKLDKSPMFNRKDIVIQGGFSSQSFDSFPVGGGVKPGSESCFHPAKPFATFHVAFKSFNVKGFLRSPGMYLIKPHSKSWYFQYIWTGEGFFPNGTGGNPFVECCSTFHIEVVVIDHFKNRVAVASVKQLGNQCFCRSIGKRSLVAMRIQLNSKNSKTWSTYDWKTSDLCKFSMWFLYLNKYRYSQKTNMSPEK